MNRFWHSWGVDFKLLYPPDAGGGGGSGDPAELPPGDPTGHPDYDFNLDDDGGAPADDPAARQPGAPPPGSSVQPPSRRTPAVAGPDSRTAALTPEQWQARYDTLETQHRTTSTQFAQSQAQIAHLTRQVQALAGLPQTPPGEPAAPMNPKDKAAVEAVYRLFPKLRGILEKADDLLGLPEKVTGFQTESQQRWGATANRMWAAFDTGVAKVYNFQTGQKLHATAQEMLDTAFMTFLERDENAAARYRLGDTTLVDDFFTMFRTGLIAPASRPAPQPGQLGRRTVTPGQPPRVPRGGPGSSVVGQQPPQPNKAKPEEIHDAAADAYFAARS